MWCETLTYDEVAQPAVIEMLARYRVDLLLAVRPWQLGDLGDAVRRVQGGGVFVGVWPMLADADGRWASASSCRAFLAFADAVLVRAPFADEVVIDLEPPHAQLDRLRRGRPTWLPRLGYGVARDAFAAATRRWRDRHRVTTAVLPMLAIGNWVQRAIGTPASALAVDRHSVMAYTTLFEGWSRGLVDRRRAERLLAACARRSLRRFGARAAVSLGTVAPGAFGDEPSYRDVGELVRDVAVARAAGIEELSLFDLGGVLRRPPAEAWFEALCGATTPRCAP